MSKKNVKAEANEFDEAIEASKSFVEKNIKPLGYGIGAVLVVVIGILLFTSSISSPTTRRPTRLSSLPSSSLWTVTMRRH